MGNDWDQDSWNKIVDNIFKEYVLEDDHEQSPMDNSVDSAEKIVNIIGGKFSVVEEKYSDAFIDKIIGGLRGEHKYGMARFLKFLDESMVENKILPPTSLELTAVKSKGVSL